MLYEIAFAFGVMDHAFHLFSIMPRVQIPMDMSLEEAGRISSVLSVECSEQELKIQDFDPEVWCAL